VTRAHPPLLLLAVACFAFAAATAHAASDPNDPNAPLPLGLKIPCGAEPSVTPGDSVAKVPAGMVFGFADPNEVGPNLFGKLPPATCASLCKRAGSTCQKDVKRLATCEGHAIDDRATFRTKVEGASDPNDPNSPQHEQQARHALVDAAVTQALSDCTTGATKCAGACGAP
jgi:hypothetical protein